MSEQVVAISSVSLPGVTGLTVVTMIDFSDKSGTGSHSGWSQESSK